MKNQGLSTFLMEGLIDNLQTFLSEVGFCLQEEVGDDHVSLLL